VDPIRKGELKNDVAITLILLKKEFPPSFFDVMMHLSIHLVKRLELVVQCIHGGCTMFNGM
jgi:hypothetical protein